MYQFSGKLKIFSIALILVGALGIAYSFLNVPSTPEEAMEIVANQTGHGDGHGDSHEDTAHTDKKDNHKKETHETKESHGDHAKKDAHVTADAHGEGHDDAHAEHVLHQMQNKPWSAFYVALLFFLGISLLVLAFYASQRVAQSGWSIVLFRVMEAITANLVPTSIIMIIVLVLTGMHYNHLFAWMADGVVDPESANFDPIVYGKRLWLNTPRWLIMGIVYLLGWNAHSLLRMGFLLLQDLLLQMH